MSEKNKKAKIYRDSLKNKTQKERDIRDSYKKKLQELEVWQKAIDEARYFVPQEKEPNGAVYMDFDGLLMMIEGNDLLECKTYEDFMFACSNYEMYAKGGNIGTFNYSIGGF